jgi:hypothetical protein
MKKLIFILTIFLVACSGSLDHAKAKALTDELIQKINSGAYDQLSQYYTDELNEGEPVEKRTEKFQKLKDVMGDVQSAELVSEQNGTTQDEFPCVVLTYKIKHTKLTSKEEFTVVARGSSYKVSEHKIEKE